MAAEARSHGDVTENAPLDAAREELIRYESRARQIRDTLSKAKILSGKVPESDMVTRGSTVRVRDPETGDEQEYQIVSPHEVDIWRGKISAESPLGQALLGNYPADQVEVETPGGRNWYEIVGIVRDDVLFERPRAEPLRLSIQTPEEMAEQAEGKDISEFELHRGLRVAKAKMMKEYDEARASGNLSASMSKEYQDYLTLISQIIGEPPTIEEKIELEAQSVKDRYECDVCGKITRIGRMFPYGSCLLYTSPSPRDRTRSRMPSSA